MSPNSCRVQQSAPLARPLPSCPASQLPRGHGHTVPPLPPSGRAERGPPRDRSSPPACNRAGKAAPMPAPSSCDPAAAVQTASACPRQAFHRLSSRLISLQKPLIYKGQNQTAEKNSAHETIWRLHGGPLRDSETPPPLLRRVAAEVFRLASISRPLMRPRRGVGVSPPGIISRRRRIHPVDRNNNKQFSGPVASQLPRPANPCCARCRKDPQPRPGSGRAIKERADRLRIAARASSSKGNALCP